MCLEAHYICMVKQFFQHTALVSFNVWQSYKVVLLRADDAYIVGEIHTL